MIQGSVPSGVGSSAPVFALLLVFLAVLGPTSSKADVSLTLLHSQDNFGSVVPVDSSNNPCKPLNVTPFYTPIKAGSPCYGGLDRRSGMVAQVRSEVGSSAVVLVDAGNSLAGSLFYLAYGSEVIARYYSLMQCDAVKLEVHDFITRVEQVANLTRLLSPNTTVVSANIVNLNNDTRFVNITGGGAQVQPYAQIDLGGGNVVGFVGTTGANLNGLFADPRQINSTDELLAMRNTVALLQNKGINMIVAAVSGPTVVDIIVNEVPGVDVVIVVSELYGTNITTETSTAGPYPTVRWMPWGQPVLIVGTGSNSGMFLGRLDLVFDDFGVITSWAGAPILLDDSAPLDMAMHSDILARQAIVDNQSSKVVGETLEDLGWENECMFGECTLGLWTTDAMRRAIPGAQIAMYNGGSMYAAIPAGNITLGQIQTAMPLVTSALYTCQLQGQYIWSAMENSVMLVTNTSLNINQGIGRFLSVSGMRVLYNPNEQVGMRIVQIWVENSDGGWDLLDPEAFYLIATFHFVWAGGDGFTMISQNCKDSNLPGLTALTVFLNDLQLHSPISNLQSGRLNVTSLSRRTCLSPDGQVCSGNGNCFLGACQCTAAGATGPLCSFNSMASDSSSDLSPGAIAGIVVGAVIGGLCVLLVVIVVTALLASLRKRPVEQEWMIDFEELEIGDQLGRGGYGEVYRGRWKGTEVAVKTMSAQQITREMKKSFVEEASVMSRLRHPNVVLFMAASTKPPLMCIVMEYMALGSLYDLLHNDLVSDIPFPLKLKLLYQAAKGMHFLHSSGIVHRDLKSLNLLLDNKWNVKVADFGLTGFKDSIRRKSNGSDDGVIVGSVPWMAPELLQEMPDVDFVLADIYAFGIIMWEVLTRRKPFDGLTAPQVAVAVIKNDLRPQLPRDSEPSDGEKQFVELMTSCWHRDATVRPVFLDIMHTITVIGNSGSGSSNIFSSSTGSSSSSGSASHKSYQYSSGKGSGSKGSTSSSRSEEAPLAKGESVPRRDVSFVVCDLARFDDVWRKDPAGADRAIGQFGKLVRQKGAVHHGHVFSQPSFHSGGTFMLAFSKPTNAAAFALDLQHQIAAVSDHHGGKTKLLGEHARISVTFRAGSSTVPTDDRMRTMYDPKDFEDVLRLNTGCPSGAIVCSTAFREQVAGAQGPDAGGEVEFVDRKDGSVLVIRVGDEAFRHDNVDSDGEDDRDGDGDDKELTTREIVAARDREAGVCSSNMCPWIINTDRLEIGDRIGQGNYGQVLEGVYHGRRVAIKRLFNNRLGDESLRKMRKEAAILSSIDHPNVVKLMGLSVSDGNLLLVMELVPRGSLRVLLSNTSVPLKREQRLAMLRDAAVGIAFLHSRGIVHRDIKSSNLLVDENMSVKVGDFGFATAKQDNGTMTRCGTPSWTAPEVLQGDSRSSGGHEEDDDGDGDRTSSGTSTSFSEKVDVYSFGIVMWEVLTRRVPYEEANMMTVVMDVLQGKRPRIPSDCPPKFAKMMQQCWHQKPHKRPTMDDVLMYLNDELYATSI